MSKMNERNKTEMSSSFIGILPSVLSSCFLQ